MNFKAAVKEWLSYKAATTAPSADAVYDSQTPLAEAWIREWGGREVAAVSTLDVERRFLQRCRAVGGSRLNAERRSLRSFFEWARHRELTTKEPVETWKTMPERVEKAPVLVTETEEARLLGRLDPFMGRLVRLALLTGLRRGTLLALRWAMVEDHANGTGWLRVPGSCMKTKKPHSLPLTRSAREVLGERGADEALVFPGAPSKTAISQRFRKAAAEVDSRASFHDLRKTFATRLLSRGVPVATVMRLGGWSSQEVLFKHYVAPLEDEEAVLALNQLHR